MKQIETSIPFTCEFKWPHGEHEKWDGTITEVIDYGSHVQFRIKSRSGFNVITGNYTAGTFLMIEADAAGLGLGWPNDLFFNKEKVLHFSKLHGGHIDTVDGITAVYALKALDEAGYFPARKEA